MDIQDLEQSLQQGNIPIWATEETLQKVAKALDVKGPFTDFTKTIGRNNDRNPKTLIGGLNTANPSIQKLGKTASDASKGFDAFTKVLSGGAGVLATLAQSRGRFQDLNPIIDATASGLKSIADEIPVVGGFFKALVGLSAEVTKLNNVILDDLLDSFYGLGKAGFALNGELQQLQIDATKAGIGFTTLTRVVTENAAGILSIGGDLEGGSRKFVDTLTLLTAPTGAFSNSLKSFGYSAEETADFLGEFITVNRNNMRFQSMNQNDLAQASFEYAKNLRIISELTGTEVDDLRQARLQQMQVGAFQAKLQDMRNKQDFEGAEATAEFAQQLAGISPVVADAFMSFTAMDNAFATRESALLASQFPELEAAFINRDFDAVRNSIGSMATNSDQLNIAQLGLLEGTEGVISLLSDITNDALRIAGILDGGPSEAELREQTEAQITNLRNANTQLGDFENNLLGAADALEKLPKQIEGAVIDSLAESTAIQVDIIKAFISTFTGALGGSTTSGYDPTEVLQARKLGGTPMIGKFNEAGDQIYIDKKGIPFTMQDGERIDLNQNYGGGPTGGGMYLVGERGPELLRLSQGSMGHVYNHGQTKSLLRGRFGGGGVNGSKSDQQYRQYAGQIIPINDFGSIEFDNMGNAVGLHTSLDQDTHLSAFKTGHVEIVRALNKISLDGSSSGTGYHVKLKGNAKTGSAEGYIQGPDGKDIAIGQNPQTAVDLMVKSMEARGFGVPDANMQTEMLQTLKDMNKNMKQMFAKMSSKDGVF